MMAKIITALGFTADSAPIIVAPPIPKAKIVVVLGGKALMKYYPHLKAEPRPEMIQEPDHRVLVTYSPEYILRYKRIDESLVSIKKKMWKALKGVLKAL